ncbi:MAG TPA: FMN-binding negative transcriptional regulator [Candidatus Baltobacteraceae bacterium]|jgi:transcriptional regulator|nr:FMN-binding negative transcriptional regulator [Candidatus Baltobacteraceae bacterium]
MYIPPAFSVDDRRWAVALMERYPFGLLVTCDGPYPVTTHLPMYSFERDGTLYVAGHVAAANPHAKSIAAGAAATAVFTGAHAFISASWYQEPYATVPTWNYSAVRASGRLQTTSGYDVVRQIAERFEGDAPDSWHIDGLSPEYLEKQLRGIVAFEMRVEILDAKAKLSQNRTPEDRARVERALASSGDPVERDCAADMRAMENEC